MRNRDDGTRVPPRSSKKPSNVFSDDFLDRFDEENEPPTAPEAEVAGLGEVQAADGGFAVYRKGEGGERGHEPVGVFKEGWRARIAASVLAGTGRDPLLVLQKVRHAEGFALLAGLDGEGRPEVVGYLRHFDESLTAAMHVAEALLRSPECLAALLHAAGKVALERAGVLLDGQIPG